MKSTPAFMLRDCALWFNEDVKVGQVSKMTLPSMKVKTENVRNAGMITDAKVPMGYEKQNAKFTSVGFDPQVLQSFKAYPGPEDTLMMTGALVDEDGTANNATAYFRGFTEELGFSEWASGKLVEAIDVDFYWSYFSLSVAGAEIFLADNYQVTVGGVPLLADVRSALLL